MYGTRVVILGAGIVGAACARELAHAGFDVTVLDRAGAAGATTAHGEGNILVSDKEPGPIGLTTRSEANVASYALFQRSAAASLVSLARNP